MFIRHVVSFQSLSKLTKNVAKLIVFDAKIYEKTEHGNYNNIIMVHYYSHSKECFNLNSPNCP